MTEEKTVLELLKQLPEPIRNRAIRNALNLNPDRLNRKRTSLDGAIDAAFSWVDTPEGSAYWERVSFNSRRNDPIPNYDVKWAVSRMSNDRKLKALENVIAVIDSDVHIRQLKQELKKAIESLVPNLFIPTPEELEQINKILQ